MYELFYIYPGGVDGHGGPYFDLEVATSAARNIVNGSPTIVACEIRMRASGRVVAKVTKEEKKADPPEYQI